jgi:hypothetical protein
MAIRAPICLTLTSEFLSLMNPLLTRMLGDSASVEIQARSRAAHRRRAVQAGPHIGRTTGERDALAGCNANPQSTAVSAQFTSILLRVRKLDGDHN